MLKIAEQATWAIGNLAGDNSYFRDELIKKGAIYQLATLIAQNSNFLSVVKNGMWALCNLCRGKPIPAYQLIREGIQLICRFIV